VVQSSEESRVLEGLLDERVHVLLERQVHPDADALHPLACLRGPRPFVGRLRVRDEPNNQPTGLRRVVVPKRFKQGDFIAGLTASGIEPSKAAIKIDELLPQLSPEDLETVRHHMLWEELPNAETRPEVPAKMDECPCSGRWLGHPLSGMACSDRPAF
jgi:hypothetical protein